jgi:DNA-directed RNA polymerase specialized sigma24 family protein
VTDKAAEAPVALSPERVARRQKLVELTQRSDSMYAQLKAISPQREDIVIAEMRDGATGSDLAQLLGVSIGRIYKLRDNGLKRR